MHQSLEVVAKPYEKVSFITDKLIIFKEGLMGFESLKQYYIIDYGKNPFYWLQSNENKDVAFVIINPLYFKTDYQLSCQDEDLVNIGVNNQKDVQDKLLHYTIVTIPQDDPTKMTANLRGPIIINKENRLGKQVLSLEANYQVKHSILSEIKKQE